MHAPSQPRMQLNGKPPSKEGLQMALGMDAVPVMRCAQLQALLSVLLHFQAQFSG